MQPSPRHGTVNAWEKNVIERSMALSCVFAFALGCAADAENVLSGGRGGTSSGDAGMAGAGGTAGRGGSGGLGGMSGDGGGCFQGTFSLYSRVNGAGFDYADGTSVRAYFASWGETESPTDTVKAGAFSFDFSFPSEVCDLGASRPGGGALYIDVDGDGECSVTQDDIFVWTAETRGGNGPYAISPDSSRCHGMNPGTPGTDAYALAAAQHLCPSVGDCLTFCGPEPSTVNGYFVAFCPSPDAGAPDAGKVDSGESDAGPSDAGH